MEERATNHSVFESHMQRQINWMSLENMSKEEYSPRNQEHQIYKLRKELLTIFGRSHSLDFLISTTSCFIQRCVTVFF